MKKFWFVCLFVLSLTLLAACGGTDSPAQGSEPATDTLTLRFGLLPDTQSVPIAMAAYLGYFDDAGINVEITRFTSAAERDSALQAGNLDAAISDLVAVALFHAGGFDVSATSQADGCQTILASAASGVTDIAGLAGTTVALSENTVMEYTFDQLLTKQGYDADNYVVKTYIPQITVRLEMLQNDQVDAVIMPEPQISVAKQSGAVELSSSEDYSLKTTCLIFRDEFIDASAETVEAFYTAYNRAVEYLNGDLTAEDMAAIIAETGFPESVADTLTLPEYQPATAILESDVQSVIDWMLDKELLETALTMDELVDARFVAEP